MATVGISKQACLDIWELLESGVEGKTAARLLKVAPSTVSRINTVFRAVRDGTTDQLADSATRSLNIMRYAEELFHPASVPQETSSVDADRLKEIYQVLCGISYGITKMNEKLERLCEVWEGKE